MGVRGLRQRPCTRPSRMEPSIKPSPSRRREPPASLSMSDTLHSSLQQRVRSVELNRKIEAWMDWLILRKMEQIFVTGDRVRRKQGSIGLTKQNASIKGTVQVVMPPEPDMDSDSYYVLWDDGTKDKVYDYQLEDD